jgi:hypothetical protein
MSSVTLPADPEKPGNVWCEACLQSLAANRTAAHIVSKKHTENIAGRSTETAELRGGTKERAEPKTRSTKKAVAPEPRDEKLEVIDLDSDRGSDAIPSATVEKKIPVKKSTKKAASPGGLPADPEKIGNYWCGLCRVSLKPGQAESHVETARHKDNSVRHLTHAVKNVKLNDK